jgi:5'(3')-deoxyribonucleotidase
MRVAVDFDSTLADTLSVVIDLLNFKHGSHLTREDIVSWDWVENARRYGFPDPEAVAQDFWRIYDLFDTTHLRRAIPPVDPVACAAVKWLVKRGHDVHIVTSNKPRAEESIRSWLFGHGLELPLDIIGRMTASQKAELPYDYYIDDAPGLAEAVNKLADGRIVKLFLVPQPYNRHVPRSERVETGFTWRHALDLFEREGL